MTLSTQNDGKAAIRYTTVYEILIKTIGNFSQNSSSQIASQLTNLVHTYLGFQNSLTVSGATAAAAPTEYAFRSFVDNGSSHLFVFWYQIVHVSDWRLRDKDQFSGLLEEEIYLNDVHTYVVDYHL